MIVHHIGADTRIDYDWLDDAGLVITPTEASFDVTDADGASVLALTMGDFGFDTTVDHALELHLEDDWQVDAGLYAYVLRISDGVDWSILSAGMLRVK